MGLLDTTVDTVTTPGLLTNIGTVLTKVLGWIPDVFEAMIDSPIILLFVALAVVGTVVAFARKILM